MSVLSEIIPTEKNIIKGKSLIKNNSYIEIDPSEIIKNKNTVLSYICPDSSKNLQKNNDSTSIYTSYYQTLNLYDSCGKNIN